MQQFMKLSFLNDKDLGIFEGGVGGSGAGYIKYIIFLNDIIVYIW